jgi:hypothetical protein
MKNSNFVVGDADRWISVQHASDIAEVSDSTIRHLVQRYIDFLVVRMRLSVSA